MAGAAIRAEGLESGYGSSRILFGVDFEAAENEITVIVGPNGSGKSTLLKSMFGLCTVHAGSITYGGSDITGMAPHDVARMGVAYLPQVDNVFANLSVRENFAMAGYTLGREEAAGAVPSVLEAFPALSGHLQSKAETLSGGQRQMLAMAMAMIRRPRLMLFDEPTASLSPKLAGQVVDRIQHLRDEMGMTIILVEQNVKRALELADKVCLLAGGKGQFAGNPKELLAHPELGRLYLGLT